MSVLQQVLAALGGGGAGGGSSHRYWRINITSNNGGSLCSILEMEYRATIGGSDLTGSGTADASSSANGANLPSLAFDGNFTNKWTSGGGPPQWLSYDFSSPVSVAQVAIYATIAGQESFAPQDFNVQWSDDNSSWTTALAVTGQTGWTSAVRTFDI